MKIGVSGHQKREGLDWNWVQGQIRTYLSSVNKPVVGICSLAEGADQLFASEIVRIGGELIPIIPFANYDRTFSRSALQTYKLLMAGRNPIQLDYCLDDEHSYLNAGKYVVDLCDVLIAVWDGHPAAGLGGTGDIVDYAKSSRKPILHVDTEQMATGWLA